MPQLSLYLPEEEMEVLRRDSANANKSLSKYVAGLIRDASVNPSWPVGYWTEVYGSLKDPSFVVPPEVEVPLDEIVL